MQFFPKVPQPKCLLAATSCESGCCSVERACKKTSDFIGFYWQRIKCNLVIIFLPWQQEKSGVYSLHRRENVLFLSDGAGVCCFNGPDVRALRVFFPFFLYLLCFSKQDDLCRGVSGETENRSHYKKKDRENGGGGAAQLL